MSREANVVYIGRKPVMTYVLAVMTSFNAPNTDKVVLKARGRAITAAVDVAEISRRRFLQDVKVEKIDIGTEQITIQEENRTKNVSTMEITLARAPPIEKQTEDEGEEEGKTPVKLTDIEGIGVKRAEKLKSSGINSVRDLANSDLTKLSEDLGEPFVSEETISKWIDEAKKVIKSQ